MHPVNAQERMQAHPEARRDGELRRMGERAHINSGTVARLGMRRSTAAGERQEQQR
jgi:hypothetical protein